MNQEKIKKAIGLLSAELQGSFIDSESLIRDQASAIIRLYTAAFIGNFMTWLGAGAIASRSAEARYAMAENLEVEFRDDHQGMLWSFAASVNAVPNAEDYVAIHSEVQDIRQKVAGLNGIQLTALAAILESASLVFIPYLEAIALKLSGNRADLKYTRVHGEADIVHADQFIHALEVEMQRGYVNPEQDLQAMIDLSKALLKTIFSPTFKSLHKTA